MHETALYPPLTSLALLNQKFHFLSHPLMFDPLRPTSIRLLWLSTVLKTAIFAVDAAISASNSSCSFCFLNSSCCVSIACLVFNASARAISAALSASACTRADTVEGTTAAWTVPTIGSSGERDFTKYNMFQDQHQSELRDNFSGNIFFRLMIRVRCFYTLVNQLSFPIYFSNKLWVGLGLGVGIGLSLYFWTVMLIQDKQKMLIQEHVLLGKITANRQ